MKKVIIIIIDVFITVSMFGQILDTTILITPHRRIEYNIDSSIFTSVKWYKQGIYTDSIWTIKEHYDTVKVIMLLSDTSTHKSWVLLLDKNATVKEAISPYIPYCFWEYGYSVREKHNTDEDSIDPYFTYGYKCRDYFIHKFYLDENKNPLNKNYIVWQSQQIK